LKSADYPRAAKLLTLLGVSSQKSCMQLVRESGFSPEIVRRVLHALEFRGKVHRDGWRPAVWSIVPPRSIRFWQNEGKRIGDK
jgi:hypothetical protein